MRFSKKFVFAAIIMCGLFLLSILGEAKSKIDVEKEIMARINANPDVIAKLIKKLYKTTVNGADFKLVQFEVLTMKQVSTPKIDISALPEQWQFVTAKEVINCTGDPVSKTMALTGTTASSKSVNKTVNFSHSYSGTVGIDFMIFSGSATSSWTAGYSQSWTDTESESYSATDSTTVQLNEKGGRVYTLESKHLVGSVPYQAVYEIDDNCAIKIKFEGKGGSARVFKHRSYGGASKSYNAGSEEAEISGSLHDNISSVKVDGGLIAELFEHKNFGGKSKAFTQNTDYVGDDMNDKTSSIQVRLREFGQPMYIVYFKMIKDLIPLKDRRFTAEGTMDVDYSWKTPVTRVTIANVSDDYFNASCGNASAAGQVNVGNIPGFGLKQKTLTKAQYQRLLRSGKIK